MAGEDESEGAVEGEVECCPGNRGWLVIHSDSRGLCIQRCDDCRQFVDDDAAEEAAGDKGARELAAEYLNEARGWGGE